MSDGSFPHPIPEPSSDDEPDPESELAGRVLDFPTEDSGSWGPGAETSHDGEMLVPARFEVERGGELVVFPRSDTTEKRRRVDPSGESPGTRGHDSAAGASEADASEGDGEAGQSDLHVPPEDRPQYLASELLREDLSPETPLKRTLRVSAGVMGLAGLAAALGIGGTEALALGLAGVFAAIAVAGLAPLTAEVRGVALAILGTGGAALGAYPFGGEANDLSRPLVIACVVLTTGGLMFRAAHRSSRLARAMVALGLTALVLWLALTGGLDAMVVQQLAWQAWLGPVSRGLLVVVGLATALTFLDPRGTGGAWAVAGALLTWLAFDSGARVATAVASSAADVTGALDPSLLAPTVLPLLAALAAGGLCQTFVWAARRQLRAQS